MADDEHDDAVPGDDPTIPFTPEAMIDRLAGQLAERRKRIETFDDYFEGRHPLPFVPEAARGAFAELLKRCRSNFMRLVIESKEERMTPRGIRYGDETEADKDAWYMWQANRLDLEFHQANTDTLIGGGTYGIVWAGDGAVPRITFESGSQVIVAMDSADRRRRIAALKLWVDEWTGTEHATLYTPSFLWKYSERENPKKGESRWQPRESRSEAWPLPNPLGVVPVVPMRNRPRLLDKDFGRSELDDVTTNQDIMNKTLFDIVVGAEFIGMPQRWATGVPLFDEETGEPLDIDIDVWRDRFLLFEDPNTKVGQLPEAQLANLVRIVEMHAQHIATITSTPPHYLLGSSGTFPSGESLKAVETGLVAKAMRHMTDRDEPLEEILGLGFAVQGDTRADVVDAEILWDDPESRTMSELVASVVQLKGAGVPRLGMWEQLGFSPQKIERYRELARQEAADASMLAFDLNSQFLADMEPDVEVPVGAV